LERPQRKAAVATAHTILKIAYYVSATGQPYVEFGADFGSQATVARERRLARELQRLGYPVSKAA
jgi:transposase